MTIDHKTLKPGGKVDLTFKDGSKVIEAKLYKYGSSLTILPGSVTVVYGSGSLNINIVSIDAYTPPEPEWAKHRFCLAGGSAFRGDVWERASDGLWWCHTRSIDKSSTQELDRKYEGMIVALVPQKEGNQS